MDEEAVREVDEPRTDLPGDGHCSIAAGNTVRRVQPSDRRTRREVRVERNTHAGRRSDRHRNVVGEQKRPSEEIADARLK